MTADEMFKKLGYDIVDKDGLISYTKFSDDSCEFIGIDKEDKEVSKYFVYEFTHIIGPFTFDELRAVYKKIEELESQVKVNVN